jgi:hypothetical protein
VQVNSIIVVMPLAVVVPHLPVVRVVRVVRAALALCAGRVLQSVESRHPAHMVQLALALTASAYGISLTIGRIQAPSATIADRITGVLWSESSQSELSVHPALPLDAVESRHPSLPSSCASSIQLESSIQIVQQVGTPVVRVGAVVPVGSVVPVMRKVLTVGSVRPILFDRPLPPVVENEGGPGCIIAKFDACRNPASEGAGRARRKCQGGILESCVCAHLSQICPFGNTTAAPGRRRPPPTKL